ncbi:MAG TPA: hypothetical protein VGM06_12795 [Polyangiaceae bacterium]|jgi:serine/threonine-protein kinase
MKPIRWGITAGAVLLVQSAASTAHADDGAAAQALFDQGKKSLAAHDYAAACPKFEESYRLEPGLGTLLNLADCYEHEGKLATAWSKFLEVASKARSAGQTARAQIAKDRAAALAPRLSNLVIAVPGGDKTPGIDVKRDGTSVGTAEWGTPIPADSGAHLIEAAAPGRQPWSMTANVDEGGKTTTVTVPDLAPVPPKPLERAETEKTTPKDAATPAPTAPDTGAHGGGFGAQRVLSIVAGVVGVAGIGVGTYFGVVSMGKHNDAQKLCGTATCMGPGAQEGSSDWSDATTAGNYSTIAFIVGGVGLAGAAVLWLTAPRSAEQPAASARLGVGPGSVRLEGTF